MKWLLLLPLAFLTTSCASLGLPFGAERERTKLWDQAHGYFAEHDFGAADSVFSILAEEYPRSNEGRESLFYLGVIRLDPRNPRWSSDSAEAALGDYLADPEVVHRRPEGEMLLELAHQINLPMEERFPGLQQEPETRTVIMPSRDGAAAIADNERLRRDLAAKEAEVKQLREELARIQKLLTGQ